MECPVCSSQNYNEKEIETTRKGAGGVFSTETRVLCRCGDCGYQRIKEKEATYTGAVATDAPVMKITPIRTTEGESNTAIPPKDLGGLREGKEEESNTPVPPVDLGGLEEEKEEAPKPKTKRKYTRRKRKDL